VRVGLARTQSEVRIGAKQHCDSPWVQDLHSPPSSSFTAFTNLVTGGHVHATSPVEQSDITRTGLCWQPDQVSLVWLHNVCESASAWLS